MGLMLVEGVLLFHLSACENVWPDMTFVNGGECLTSGAMSSDIILLLIRQNVCSVLFVSVVPKSEGLSEHVLAVNK